MQGTSGPVISGPLTVAAITASPATAERPALASQLNRRGTQGGAAIRACAPTSRTPPPTIPEAARKEIGTVHGVLKRDWTSIEARDKVSSAQAILRGLRVRNKPSPRPPGHYFSVPEAFPEA